MTYSCVMSKTRIVPIDDRQSEVIDEKQVMKAMAAMLLDLDAKLEAYFQQDTLTKKENLKNIEIKSS